ncbi:MAG TPA: TolC family protein [Candidatus Aminicenantes bacterium]|nr:TolC family protein [Candidatus Aminicenantes bacterium]HRY65657.1 TolC family protein [Candidatus Aminicenantes bacterium]HRZ72455.1 TolC family protein [Candidatus Aminicenantes bacterium]
MPVTRPFVPILIAAAALALAPPLSAELPAQTEGLTLDQAVETALARNPEVLAAQARVDAARGRTLQLRSRPAPEVTAGVEGVPIPGLKKAGDEIEVHLGLEQAFEYPGKRRLRSEIGRLGEDMAQAELDRVRLLLGARVKRAYWAAVFAGSAAEALERSSARLDALIEDLQAKYRTGAAAYADLLRARAEKARLKNQILEQGREERQAELALDELLGRPAGEPLTLATALPFVPLQADAAALVERARAGLPSFRIAALRSAQADSAVKLAGLGRRPDFLAGFLLPSVRTNAWGVSFGMTMPFLRPGRAKGQLLEATAEAEAGRWAAAALDRRVRTAVESAYVAAKSAEEQVLVYERSLLRELEDELAIELEYFRFGKTEALGLLDLHRTFVLAQVEHLRALFLYNLSLADLEAAGESAD